MITALDVITGSVLTFGLGYASPTTFRNFNCCMSKQIDLFAGEAATHKNRSHMEEHRPDKLSLSSIEPVANPKWAECKVLGKNILIRSYASACVCDDE